MPARAAASISAKKTLSDHIASTDLTSLIAWISADAALEWDEAEA